MLDIDKSTWKRAKFGDIVKNINDYYVPEADGILPYVAGPHIDPTAMQVRSYGSTSDDNFPPTFKRKFKAGDVLLHTRGIEKIAVVDGDGVTGEKLFVLRAIDSHVLDQRFLPVLLRSPVAAKYLENNFTGSVNRFLNWKPLAAWEFDLPPLDEQKRIADLLWAVERHSSAIHMLAKSSRLAEAASRRSFIESFPTDSTGAELFDISLGRQRAPQHHAGDHMLPYIRSANVSGSGIDTSDVKSMNFTPEEQKQFALKRGDVLVSEGSASGSAVGVPAVWAEEIPGVVCFQKTLLRYRSINSISIQPYVYQWCLWAHESGEFYRISSGTNIFHITAVGAKNMKVSKPPIDAQQQFVSRMEKLQAATVKSNAELSSVLDLRTSLLSSFFGGS